MKTCENCIHNRGCIESANYHSAETRERYEVLKNCLKCNGNHLFFKQAKGSWYIKCVCGYYEQSQASMAKATEVWNRRVENADNV